MSEPGDDRLLTEWLDSGLRGRVEWVTGASRGPGRRLAFALAGCGTQLLLCARSVQAVEDVAEEISDQGGIAEVVVGSIADPEMVSRAAQIISQRWGRLDELINNAGISPEFSRAERVDVDICRDVLGTNLSAPLLACRATLPLVKAAGGDSVVNVTSVHGARGHERLIAYAASKGGLEMVTRTLDIEWADRGIRVNAVAPGYFETEMTAGLQAHERWETSVRAWIPMGRFGTTAEIAPAMLFLARPGSRYITGSTLFVDGGWTAG